MGQEGMRTRRWVVYLPVEHEWFVCRGRRTEGAVVSAFKRFVGYSSSP